MIVFVFQHTEEDKEWVGYNFHPLNPNSHIYVVFFFALSFPLEMFLWRCWGGFTSGSNCALFVVMFEVITTLKVSCPYCSIFCFFSFLNVGLSEHFIGLVRVSFIWLSIAVRKCLLLLKCSIQIWGNRRHKEWWRESSWDFLANTFTSDLVPVLSRCWINRPYRPRKYCHAILNF